MSEIIAKKKKPILGIVDGDRYTYNSIQTLSKYCIVKKYENLSSLKKPSTECDIIWLRLRNLVCANEFAKSPKCKYVVTSTTGLTHIDLEFCRRQSIKVISLAGHSRFLKNIYATAEHTLAITLALVRNICSSYQKALLGEWSRTNLLGEEIAGKNVGIVGYGRLGQMVADRFQAFGAKIYYFDKVEKRKNKHHIQCKDMNELCSKSDIITIHINGTVDNYDFLRMDHFNKMSRNPYLINTSRGEVINERDLLIALNSNVLRGAALDVVEDETKYCKNNDICKYANEHSNLLLTTHIGGYTKESLTKVEKFMANRVLKIIKENV